MQVLASENFSDLIWLQTLKRSIGSTEASCVLYELDC